MNLYIVENYIYIPLLLENFPITMKTNKPNRDYR